MDKLTIEEIERWRELTFEDRKAEDAKAFYFAGYLVDVLRENERLLKALGKEITCVCQSMVGTPVKIYHHRYCLNNPYKDSENGN